MNRIDRRMGRLHYIQRTYKDDPQYGVLAWGRDSHRLLVPTLDIWIHRVLITLRWTDAVR